MTVLTLVVAAALALPPMAREVVDTACQVLKPKDVPVAGRKSPLDSLTFLVARRPIKLCYGRPAARGRVMLGGEAVPYGKLWRTGANEPTIFFTPIPILVAGIKVPPGTYSLYTVPGEREWDIIVNRSTTQWGHERSYTPEVQAQEVGRGTVPSEAVASPVDTFTIRTVRAGRGATLLLEWERARVPIPIRPG